MVYNLKSMQKEICLFDVPTLHHPFTCMISGPTGCGKSTFVSKLLEMRQDKIDPAPDRVIWCYSEWQPLYNTMIGSVEFHQGLPENIDTSVRNLVILDDLMTSVNSQVTELFTKGSHHRNISVIYIVQNLFQHGKEHRTISLIANTWSCSKIQEILHKSLIWPNKCILMILHI